MLNGQVRHLDVEPVEVDALHAGGHGVSEFFFAAFSQSLIVGKGTGLVEQSEERVEIMS